MNQPQLPFIEDLDLCPFCRSRPVTLLCDGLVGFLWNGDFSTWSGSEKERRVCAGPKDAKMFTCDRLICEQCTTPDGILFLDGPRYHKCIARHLCPQCKEDPREDLNPVTETEAVLERKRMWKRSIGLLRSL